MRKRASEKPQAAFAELENYNGFSVVYQNARHNGTDNERGGVVGPNREPLPSAVWLARRQASARLSIRWASYCG